MVFRNKLYDEIVGKILQNVLIEEARCGKIVIWDFRPKYVNDRLYYHISLIDSAIHGDAPVYLDMGFFSYLKFKFTHRKTRVIKRLKRKDVKELLDKRISSGLIVEFVKDFYKVDDNVMEDILEKYYEGKDESNNY